MQTHNNSMEQMMERNNLNMAMSKMKHQSKKNISNACQNLVEEKER